MSMDIIERQKQHIINECINRILIMRETKNDIEKLKKMSEQNPDYNEENKKMIEHHVAYLKYSEDTIKNAKRLLKDIYEYDFDNEPQTAKYKDY